MEQLRIKLLGVRGTVPVHGPAFARYGGATSCVLVRAGGENIILDAGTGLQGADFRAFCPGDRFTLLLSHSHVDHLMGFPIFSPLFDPNMQGDIYLRTRPSGDARAQIEALMSPPLWPIRTGQVAAKLTFHDVPRQFSVGPVQVTTQEACHPGGCTLYRLQLGDKSLVYATDHEADAADGQAFCDFARDCDLLLLDAQYTDEEYARTRGFGHATLSRGEDLAEACGAKQTRFIHHDPNRTDDRLAALEEQLQREHPAIRLGRRGEEVLL